MSDGGTIEPGAGGAAAAAPGATRLDPSRWALTTFAVLFAINLVDCTNRSVLAAVLPQVQVDLRFGDEQAGMLVFWSLLSFMVVSLLMGYVGDRVRRPWLLAVGVSVCSVAAVCSGLARSYHGLRLARVLLGVGGAVYGVLALTMLSDLFPRGVRARAMAWFYLAMPLGGGLGMALGGWLATRSSWHVAFFVVAVPGMIAALAAVCLPDPVRGQSEGVLPERLRAHERAGASREDYIDLMVNSSYTYSVLGMAFYTFAFGGLAYWLPKFLTVTKHIPQARATSVLALISLLAAVIGMVAGGGLADRLAKISPRALFLVPGLALLGSIPFTLLAIHGTSEPAIYAGVFLAEALMFLVTGPCNAVIANVVMPNMRASAFAVTLFAVHLLGDLWSPTLMGWVADTFGRRDSMESVFGRALTAISATPSARHGLPPENLTAGLLVVIPALVLAGGVLLSGARHLPREMALMLAKLKASPSVPRSSRGRR
jgi:predicted MFS family arabinose efflux permease